MATLPVLTHQHYTVGWICALPSELTAAMAMLDKEHSPLSQHAQDNNTYTLGQIGEHFVVIACLPAGQTGNNSAATVAAQMRYSFRGIRFGLMVGIGGGVPSEQHDIRLGDVVVSNPGKHDGGVIQYDFGRTVTEGRFVRNGTLNAPPTILLTAANTLKARHNLRGHRLSHYLSVMDTPRLKTKYTYQDADSDILFKAEYDHIGDDLNCDQCDKNMLVLRPKRDETGPIIHYGSIASGNQVMRHGETRERWGRESGVLCFEMEAAGLMADFPCLVIRGICDYADSHKNKRWQEYAAATAAAYAKELLSVIPGSQVVRAHTVSEATRPLDSLAFIERIFSVPFERDKRFVGREEILSQIEKQLEIQSRVALHGLGGIGKSQIAIEYCYKYQAAHPRGHVFWVYAANSTRFGQGFKEIGRKLNLPRIDNPEVDACELVSTWLNENNGEQWLMVLDNADNMDLFFPLVATEVEDQVRLQKKPLSEYLPQTLGLNRKIIITTRNRRLGEDLSHGELCVDVPPFSRLEARALFQSKAGIDDANWSDANLDKLLDMLGCIPLAVTQAASFIKRNTMSTKKYLEILERDEQDLKQSMNRQFQDHRRERGISNSVFQTWRLSYEQIRKQYPRAAAMLSLMTMLDRQQIPEILLRVDGESEFEFLTAIEILDDFALITKETEKEALAMHRLVQLSVHVWLEQYNQRGQYEEEALAVMANKFPTGEHENKDICESFLPHALSVLRYEHLNEASKIQRAELFYKLSWFDWRQGRYAQAHSNILEAQIIYSGLHHEENLDTLKCQSLMAVVLECQGKYKEAEAIHRQILGEYEKVLGKEHPYILTNFNNLALVLVQQGKYGEAEAIHRQTLEGSEKVLGKEHPDTLTSISNLAVVLERQGKYEEAEAMERQALKGREKMLGMEHPTTLINVSNLALVLERQGKYEMAEAMGRQALKGKEKVLGAEHPATLDTVYCLAHILHGMRQYHNSSKLYQRAIAGFQLHLGSHHPTALECIQNYSLLLDEMNKAKGPSEELIELQ